ncbi:GNAT family protein [soil metagenome]
MDITLTPLREATLDELMLAAEPEEVWRLMPWPIGRERKAMVAYIEAALRDEDAGTALPFAIRVDGRLVGSTRFSGIERAHEKAEIGYTWLHPSMWRTGVNRRVKRMMLDRAFGEMGLNRIYFYIDQRNDRSQKAVEGIGAVHEGVLREDRLLHDGYRRSTVVYSLLANEWPEKRASLRV